jgi:phosphatidylserine/phosphatidylglycerophosphate/cardiolipin synthase-like enzyme
VCGVCGVAVERKIIAPPPPVVHFSPNGGCTQAVVEAIQAASTEIRVQAYVFTSADIANALFRAQQRKAPVKVYLLIDKGHGKYKNDQTAFLRINGVETREDCSVKGSAHDKVMIIDQRKVITGSFNYTNWAENENGENLVILERKDIAAQFLRNWDKHWNGSQLPAQPKTESPAGPISPEAAIQRVGQICHVRMKVATAAEVDGVVYLNYLDPYDVPNNLAIRVFPNTGCDRHVGRCTAVRFKNYVERQAVPTR